MDIYNFPNHTKGDTFTTREINLGFDITGSTIKMQFKLSGSIQSAFAWSTLDNTFTVNNPLTGAITMNKRILDLKPATYVYDFQVTDSLGNVTTYFKGSILIIQDITQ
jgi:hypothetical protein